MNLYDDNIRFLKKHYPALLTVVLDNNEQLDYERSTTRNQEPNLIVVKNNKEYYLHSKYNAEEEARKWTLSLNKDQVHSEHLLIIGCGLGYYLEQLIEYSTASSIYVYEPDTQIFNAWLRFRDVRKVLLNSRIRLFVVGEHDLRQTQLTRQIAVYAKESFYIAVPPTYNKLFQSIISNIYYKMKESFYAQLSNHATHIRFQEEWITNILYNLPYTIISTPVSKLREAGKGMTAIIVGSGPSLQYDIHFLLELKSSCLIIAAGSSIQALEHFGISPHLVVSIDGGIPNLRVFENVDTRQSPLLFCPHINYSILEHFKAPLIAAILDNDLITPSFSGGQELPVFNSTSSVTGTAIQAAVYMGVSQIVLMGQDLSYPGKQFYSAGVRHVSEEKMSDHLKNATQWVPNVDGGQNPTTLNMRTTLEDMELLIHLVSFQEVRVINSSRHGAVIRGTEWIPMDELVLQLSEISIHDFELSKYLMQMTVVEKVTSLNKLKIELQLLIKQTNDVGKWLEKLFSSIDILSEKVANSNINTISKKLAEVDKLWSRITRDKAFEVLYSLSLKHHIDIYMKYVAEIVETEDVRKKSKLIVDHLGTLVKAMDEFTPELLRILEDSMRRLDRFMDGLSLKN